MKVGESSENYIKAIHILRQTQGEIRCIDLARYMDVSKASISHAVAVLERDGMLKKEDRYLKLTPKGEELSRQILEKHRFFTQLLITCGVEEKLAEEEACGLEHGISNDSFKKVQEKLVGKGVCTNP